MARLSQIMTSSGDVWNRAPATAPELLRRYAQLYADLGLDRDLGRRAPVPA